MVNRAVPTRPTPGRLPVSDRCRSRRRSCRPALVATLALGSFFLLSATGLAAAPITVTHPWFRYIMPEVPAGGYMTLTNATSRSLILTGASSLACGVMMLHRTEQSGGMDRMVAAGTVAVPAHGTFRFAPGGDHIMCMHPVMQVGASVPVTLTFADGSKVQVSFTVYGVGGPPTSSPTGPVTTTKMKMPM